jgi:hypothetical protein
MENESWVQMLEDIALEALDDEFDDSDDFDFELAEDDEFDDAEFDLSERRRARRRPAPVNRARPRQRYSQALKGRSQGMVRTPQGTARVALPGKFPTVPELRKTVDRLQGDISKNSSGIEQLRKQQQNLTTLLARTEKRLTKRARNAQIAAIVAISIPLVARIIEQRSDVNIK